MSTAPQGDYWTKIDEQLKKAVAHAEQAYRTNYWINIVIVVIGTILVAFSLVLSAIQGANPSTVTYAGLGIADFIALFFVDPQKRLLKLLGDFGQVTLIYKTWMQQVQMIDNMVWSEKDQKYTIAGASELKDYIADYARIGDEALAAIEKYIGTQ